MFIDLYPIELSTMSDEELEEIIPDNWQRTRVAWYLMGDGWRRAIEEFGATDEAVWLRGEDDG